MEAVFTFQTTHEAIGGERALLDDKINVKVMALPSALGAGCGLCLRVDRDETDKALQSLKERNISPEGMYVKISESGRTTYQPLVFE